LIFWKDHERELPTLARVARDIFSIPATGAGVERLFNSARDVYHYRRGSLNATTIQDIIMFRCISSFDFKDEEDTTLDDPVLTPAERQEMEERQEADLPRPSADPISDDEEDEDGEDHDNSPSLSLQNNLTVKVQAPLSEHMLRKRRQYTPGHGQEESGTEDDDDSRSLPRNSTQVRVSSRQKRPRKEDNDFVYNI
jgi:hAT family C-terminal dimerisation region